MATYDQQGTRDKRPIVTGDDGFTGLNSHTHPRLLAPGILSSLTNGRLEADGMVVTRPGLSRWLDPKIVHREADGSRIDSLFFYDTPEKEALFCWLQVDQWAGPRRTPGDTS